MKIAFEVKFNENFKWVKPLTCPQLSRDAGYRSKVVCMEHQHNSWKIVPTSLKVKKNVSGLSELKEWNKIILFYIKAKEQ